MPTNHLFIRGATWIVALISTTALAAVAACALTLLCATSAFASSAGAPAWQITAMSIPTNFQPVSTGAAQYQLVLINVGAAPTDGSHVTFTDTLPAGVTATKTTNQSLGPYEQSGDLMCTPSGANPVVCTGTPSILPGQSMQVHISVNVAANAAASVTNDATVSGGGAPAASTAEPTTVSSATPSFGVQSDGFATNADGSPATQAGSHPYQFTTNLDFTTAVTHSQVATVDNVKTVTSDLPAGFIGDPSVTPKCSQIDFSHGECPDSTAIGVAYVRLLAFTNPGEGPVQDFESIYNLQPPPGVPAQFGILTAGAPFSRLTAGVRTGAGYALHVDLNGVSQAENVAGATLTFWGDPADPSHDPLRGRCLFLTGQSVGTCSVASLGFNKPLLTLPTSCAGPQTVSFAADSWQNQATFVSSSFVWHDLAGKPVGFDGCNGLDFSPTITTHPDVSSADSPFGLNFDLHIPEAGLQEPNGLAEADLKKAVVTLPQGVSVNPAAAEGLAACSPGQIELSGPNAPTCPDAAKIGTAEVDTPLVAHTLPGAIYLATQNENPFGSLLAIYIVVDDPATGVIVKLPGHVAADPSTGQLTTTFDDNPQLPFTHLKLEFFGGPRAALATPMTCGTFQTTSQLTPWSDPSTINPATPGDSFTITAGANATPCASTLSRLSFAPAFAAGTLNPVAGAFSPFSVTFSRADQDQELGSITVQGPPGLLGKIAGVPLCPEPQASVGACPAASQIGHVAVGAGAGPNPVWIPQAGRREDPVYLTGPYKGAPFGLVILVHAEAGPFNLGDIPERAAITVDPHTSQIVVTSDALPIMDNNTGIPADIRAVRVMVDRPGFMFNPTSCEPMSVNGTIISTQDVSAPVSNHFQVGNCATLPFKPAFSVSTQGSGNFHGASLDVKIAEKPGEANIHKVDVQLPVALPSRLATLQKACTESQFAANPAGCPAGSVVGTARAVTPVLNVPLAGPAILVSHGGAAFPDLDIILQGEGVTIILTGNTDIKRGITYSRFDTAPDAPISSFELNLPGGPGAVLAATKNLCALTKTVTVTKHVTRHVHGRVKHVTVKIKKLSPEPLLMPTTITGQNGAVEAQTTKIAVTGCPKAKPKGKKARKAHQAHKRKQR